MHLSPPSFFNSQKQAGNALFLILIAVALFAALSYAVTQSGRGSGTIDKEQKLLVAAQIVQYGGDLQQAVFRMTLNGCTASTLSFYSSSFATPADYGSAPAGDESCFVFYPNGGAVSWQHPPTSIQSIGGSEYFITGTLQVKGVGTDVTNASGFEITLLSLVSKDVCLAINASEGIVNTGGDPPSTGSVDYVVPPDPWEAFSPGNFLTARAIGGNNGGDGPIDFFGHPTGCFHANAGVAAGKYFFYHVLLAR